LLPAIRRQRRGLILVETRLPSLFRLNPAVRFVVDQGKRERFLRSFAGKRLLWRLANGLVELETRRAVRATYDFPTSNEHILTSMARRAGVTLEPDERRPRVFLSPGECRRFSWASGNVAVQASSSTYWTPNKHWVPGRMGQVVSALRQVGLRVVQVGDAADEPCKADDDLRGGTSLRECAALLANASVFVGPEGGLMHLARSVDCAAVIVYTGYTRPEDTGYPENTNLRSEAAGPGCWRRTPCEHCRSAAEDIGVETVVEAARSLASRGRA
jgi:ADP-heptose:LPS heptosyltransferase